MFFVPDGLLSYSMPQGESRGVEIDLSDRTYDGLKDDTYLQGGLGQLTDGVVGDDNFKQDISGMGKGRKEFIILDTHAQQPKMCFISKENKRIVL